MPRPYPIPILEELLDQNQDWAKCVDERDPGFFKRSAEGQYPKVLWIGCCDSRVPESVIMACMPGQIFTHRNIANQVQLDDPNGISAITYAVAELGVEHIVVGGHTRCGGVAVCVDHAPDKAAAFNPVKASYGPTEPHETSSWPPPPPLDVWLTPLHDLAKSLPHPPTVLELVQINIKQQVLNLVQTDVVKNHWAGTGRGSLIGVHGWMYELETGLLQDLNCSIYGSKGPSVST